MIELIHKHPILIKVLLAVVTITFILGGWFITMEDKASFAAKVGKEKITMQEYQDSVYRLQEFYRKAYQGAVPEEIMKKLDLNRKALNALIEKKLMLAEATKRGITVSDQELSDAVTENRSFQDDTGRFNQARYAEVLRLNGMTPSVYEKMLREDLEIQKVGDLVKSSATVTEDELRDYYKKQLAAQKKEFKEDEYQSRKAELGRMLSLLAQEKALSSYKQSLIAGAKVEVNPSVSSSL
jgi:peptidyl-prolyl cis-trans isomerase D